MSRKFDAIIVGTGQSGPALAARLTQAGMQTAIIERKLIGGTCVNVGCTISLALLLLVIMASVGVWVLR